MITSGWNLVPGAIELSRQKAQPGPRKERELRVTRRQAGAGQVRSGSRAGQPTQDWYYEGPHVHQRPLAQPRSDGGTRSSL